MKCCLNFSNGRTGGVEGCVENGFGQCMFNGLPHGGGCGKKQPKKWPLLKERIRLNVAKYGAFEDIVPGGVIKVLTVSD